jgi:tetratricopeptide (TPR) repeat protein
MGRPLLAVTLRWWRGLRWRAMMAMRAVPCAVLACGLLLGALTGCTSPSRGELPLRAVIGAVAGCAALRSDGVCELEPGGELRVVLDVLPADEVSFASDRGAVVVTTQVEVEGGRRFVLRVPAGATRLSAEVRSTTWQGAFAQRLGSWRGPAWFREAESRRRKGDAEGASPPAQAALAVPEERAFALGVLGRLALRRGELEVGIQRLREASTLHRDAGRVSDAVRDSSALAHYFTQELRLAEAESVLAELEALSRGSPELTMQLALYRANLSHTLGDFAAALAAAEECARLARRLGDTVQEHAALSVRAASAVRLGAAAGAEALLDELSQRAPATFVGCERETQEVMLAFVRNGRTESLSAGEARRAHASRTADALSTALDRGAGSCDDQRLHANGHYELALAKLLASDLEGAERSLARSRELLGTRPYHALSIEWHYLTGRLAFARGGWQAAREAFLLMERAAGGEHWLEQRVRAQAHVARALVAGGSRTAALQAYARMEGGLDALAQRAPLGVDRVDASSAAERYTAAHAALWLEAGAADAALTLLLRARARAVRLLLARARIAGMSAAERTTWLGAVAELRRTHAKLDELDTQSWMSDVRSRPALDAEREKLERTALASLDAALARLGTEPTPGAVPTARPVEGELVLTFFESETGWVGIAQAYEESRSAPVPGALPGTLTSAAAWLAPFADLVRAATRLVVSTPAQLEHFDWHMVPFDGEPLIVQREVAYTLGLPRDRSRGPVVARSLLVVADPEGNLPGARAEAGWLAPFFRERGRHVQLLVQADASRAAVTRALGKHAIFHFAGHSRFDAERPWLLALSLHGGAHLAISDVLGLEAVPQLVVLSACEGARGAGGMALGAAFASAGVDTVVAAARVVDDAVSLGYARRFYAALDRDPDPLRAAREAQAGLLRALPAGDAAAFRVLVP